MKNHILTATKLIALVSIILTSVVAYGQNKHALSLNGQWQFTTQQYKNDAALLSADYQQWDKMSVPGNWDTQDKYATYKGKAYYQTNINLPANWKNKQVLLKFSAVYQTAKVWLNGKLLGEHVGGYTPFEFNISDQAKFSANNSLIVMADNTYHRGAWWAWGGISRDVDLVAKNTTRIVYQHITSVPNFETKQIDFSIKYKLQNFSNKTETLTIASDIASEKSSQKQAKTKVTLPPNKTLTKTITFVEPLNDYTLWNVEKPYLYSLNTHIESHGKTLDTQLDNFGIRKFEVRGEQFYLNNKPVRLNGVNRVHDHPDFGNTEPQSLVAKDMQDIKSMGANFSRLMHAPLSKSLLEMCDKLGYLIIGEIPVWGDDDPQSFANNPRTKQWLSEMIERDYNHPSIVGWSVGNELRDPVPDWGKKTLTNQQFDYVNSMLDFVAEKDPTRLKTYVSITAYGVNASLDNEPFDKLDFISVNSYGDAVKNVMNTHKNFPGKPIFLSEVGLKQIGGDKTSKLAPKLVGYLRKLKEFPYLTGFSIWSYNDYRSDYKGTPESGFREWGVVDEYRNKKAAYYQLKDIFEYWEK